MHVGLLNVSGSPNESDGTHNAKHGAAGVACRYRYFPVAREKDWRGGDEESHEICGPGPGARGAETCMTLGREIQMRRGGGYIRFDLAYR